MSSTALHAAIATTPAAVCRAVIDALTAKDDTAKIRAARALVRELRVNENVAVITSLLDVPEAREDATGALLELACYNSANQDAIREAGGVQNLVALLDVPNARGNAARALCDLARFNSTNQDAIREAGGVQKLVALIDVPNARGNAARALCDLARDNSANKDAIREAGGVPKLVALLDVHLFIATCALYDLADDNRAANDAIVEQMCTAGTTNVPPRFAGAVNARREEIQRAARRREYEARRREYEARGADFTPPDDFLCPITYEVMRDPVVASDGHGYEREAIERALAIKRVSPLTGEEVRARVFPNFQLKKRIREWDDTVIAAFDKAVKVAKAAAREGRT